MYELILKESKNIGDIFQNNFIVQNNFVEYKEIHKILKLKKKNHFIEFRFLTYNFSSFCWNTGMKKYFTDISWKRRIDSIQVGMQCCGIDSSDDWHKTYWLQREFLVVDSPDILK